MPLENISRIFLLGSHLQSQISSYAMNVYNLFSKLRQQISLQRTDSNSGESCNKDSTLNCTADSQDSDDDYLLVCVSSKTASTEAACQSQMITDQKNVFNGDCTTVSDPSECHRNEMLLHNPSSAVFDIPFTLHPVLDAQLQASAMFDHLNLEPSAFNYLKYSHDFTSEKLCLRDMNSDEMANIDEFLLPSANSQTSTHIPSKNSELNLMQF